MFPDNPLISMYHESVFHACNYIFTFDKTNYLEFRGMGVKHIWYLPLAVDTERMDALLGAPEEAGIVGDEKAGIMLEETRNCAGKNRRLRRRADRNYAGKSRNDRSCA